MPADFPVKTMALIAAKPELTREQFIEYYERTHAPLVLGFGSPYIAEYRRTYVRERPSVPEWLGDPEAELPFSVLTEMWFRSEEEYERFETALKDHSAEIDADEKNFIDQSRVWIFRTDERRSVMSS